MGRLQWKPLLAATLPVDYDLDKIPYPVYGSPKIDGYRCMVQQDHALTRKGIPYRNFGVQAMFGTPEFEGLDMELIVGNPWDADVFNKTQNVVMSGKKDKEAESVRGWVIDTYSIRPFAERLQLLKTLYKKHPYIHVVPQTLIKNAKQLEAYEAEQTAKGYEGVMLRRVDLSPYVQKATKENRSTLQEFYLVKWKRFEFGYATIKACHVLEHNLNEEKTATGRRSSKKSGIVKDAEGRIGSVTMLDKDRKIEFNMTVAGDKLQRWDGWQDPKRWRNVKIRYKYQLCGTKDRPRIGSCEFSELK